MGITKRHMKDLGENLAEASRPVHIGGKKMGMDGLES